MTSEELAVASLSETVAGLMREVSALRADLNTVNAKAEELNQRLNKEERAFGAADAAVKQAPRLKSFYQRPLPRLPEFDGKGDVVSFLRRVADIVDEVPKALNMEPTPAIIKMHLLTATMKPHSTAATFCQSVCAGDSPEVTTYPELAAALTSRFRVHHAQLQARTDLRQLRQAASGSGTLATYIDKFRSIKTAIIGMSDTDVYAHFVAGLTDPVRQHITTHITITITITPNNHRP